MEFTSTMRIECDNEKLRDLLSNRVAFLLKQEMNDAEVATILHFFKKLSSYVYTTYGDSRKIGSLKELFSVIMM